MKRFIFVLALFCSTQLFAAAHLATRSAALAGKAAYTVAAPPAKAATYPARHPKKSARATGRATAKALTFLF